jgi:Protein of unknown function (DUF3047)
MPMRVLSQPSRATAACLLASVMGLATLVMPLTSQEADKIAVAPFSGMAPGPAREPWRFATLPMKAKTQYTIVEMEGRRVLKVVTEHSYGNLVHDTHIRLKDSATLTWQWRVDQPVTDADLRKKNGDDGAAKLCIFFDYPKDKLPLSERLRLSLASSLVGEPVPTESLCYVYDNQLAVGTELVNALSSRIRMIVLQSGKDRLGQWVGESRDLAADYKRAFADEWRGEVPEVIGIAVQADSDNSKSNSLSYFGDIVLNP